MTAIAPTSPKLLTTRQAAERLGVAPKTIRDWVASGFLPALRIGEHGHLRFSEAAIDELLEQAAAGGVAAA